MLNKLMLELENASNPEQAKNLKKYFKTEKGQYGEGDIFLGIKMPIQRQIVKKYTNLSLVNIRELLNSKTHEHRMSALLILINKYKKSRKDRLKQREIYEFYLKNSTRINNWDLVDISCPKIIGDFCIYDGTEILKFLAKSNNLWERRISIVSTFTLISRKSYGDTLAIADMLLDDKHDLIHKAVGWMLREIGKRNIEVLEIFLKPRYNRMPRTMLRYAIEKFPDEKRKKYLKGKV